ncbi:hypothetical protein AOLI_G00027600 [Acnodon oligacanthus]
MLDIVDSMSSWGRSSAALGSGQSGHGWCRWCSSSEKRSCVGGVVVLTYWLPQTFSLQARSEELSSFRDDRGWLGLEEEEDDDDDDDDDELFSCRIQISLMTLCSVSAGGCACASQQSGTRKIHLVHWEKLPGPPEILPASAER